MTTPDLHVVLGSTGGAGNAIARALRDTGHRVRAVNRSGRADLPAGVESMASDITTPEGVARAVDGAAVVYMAAQPPYHRWPEEFPKMLERVVTTTATVGAKLVMVDNLYGYGPGAGTMTEETLERASDGKGRVRRHMTEMLLDAHRSGQLPVAIGRASDYFGPRADNSSITALAIEPVAEGKTLRWTGNLDVAHSVAYLPDIARAYVTLGTSARADGSIWILPHPAPLTGRRFLEMVVSALPEPAKVGLLSAPMLRLAAPFHKISREMLGILYQWTEPFVVDDSKFRRAFGPFDETPLEEAVTTTVAWYRAGGLATPGEPSDRGRGGRA
jgi:nucleoside-diphosphate-sugar epimerase